MLEASRERLKLVAQLALEDYRHEWVISGCAVLALADVLIPRLVLFGLKYGYITSPLGPLVENPRYREITPVTSGSYGPAWLAEMAERGDVAFVVPRTRSLAASIKLRAPGSDVGRIIDVELVPSAAGDPVLGDELPAPEGFGAAGLTQPAAEKLGVAARA